MAAEAVGAWRWVPTRELRDAARDLAAFDAVWVVPASPYENTTGALEAIRFARETHRPFLGTCGGFQHALVEFARNVAGLARAHSAEFDPATPDPVIHLMSAQESVENKGGTMRLGVYECALKPGTRARASYGADTVGERHRHRFEFNNRYRDRYTQSGFRFSGLSKDDLVEVIELRDHPWFLAVQCHPEFKSKPTAAHPLFQGFIHACVARRESKKKADGSPYKVPAEAVA